MLQLTQLLHKNYTFVKYVEYTAAVKIIAPSLQIVYWQNCQQHTIIRSIFI